MLSHLVLKLGTMRHDKKSYPTPSETEKTDWQEWVGDPRNCLLLCIGLCGSNCRFWVKGIALCQLPCVLFWDSLVDFR